jgi:hypothetical protein
MDRPRLDDRPRPDDLPRPASIGRPARKMTPTKASAAAASTAFPSHPSVIGPLALVCAAGRAPRSEPALPCATAAAVGAPAADEDGSASPGPIFADSSPG